MNICDLCKHRKNGNELYPCTACVHYNKWEYNETSDNDIVIEHNCNTCQYEKFAMHELPCNKCNHYKCWRRTTPSVFLTNEQLWQEIEIYTPRDNRHVLTSLYGTLLNTEHD